MPGPSINKASAAFRALIDEGYAEGVHDGLLIASEVAAEADAGRIGKTAAEALRDALAFFQEHRPA